MVNSLLFSVHRVSVHRVFFPACLAFIFALIFTLTGSSLHAENAKVASSEKTKKAAFNYKKNSESVRTTFQSVIEDVVPATVRVISGTKQIALGMIVNSGGWIVTKSSECPNSSIKCVLADGRSFDVISISRDNANDLAILKISAKNLPVVLRFNETPLSVGQWAVTPGIEALPLSVGVVSENSRKIGGNRAGLLGTSLASHDDGVLVTKVFPNTGAARAGLKKGDVLTHIAGREIKTRMSVSRLLKRHAPGTTLMAKYLRDGITHQVMVILGEPVSSFFTRSSFQNRMGSRLSKRRENFPSVFQHDCALTPENCGGPIVDLNGQVIGLNIARAGRVEAFAIPARLLRQRIEVLITEHDKKKHDL